MSRRQGRHAKITSRHQAQHAKPAPSALVSTAARAVPASLVAGAAGSALALSGTASAATTAPPAAAGHATPAVTAAKAAAARPRAVRAHQAAARSTYTVIPADTLSGISARFCGTPADYPALAGASGIANPNLIYAGQTVTLACRAAVVTAEASGPAPSGAGHGDEDDSAAPAVSPSPGSASYQAPAQSAQPPAAAATVTAPAGMSAFESCVISRESGGDPQAVNPASGAGGLFQFLPSTWAALGHAADYPGGAQIAPASVQETAFAELYAEAGTSPWAPYDGC